MVLEGKKLDQLPKIFGKWILIHHQQKCSLIQFITNLHVSDQPFKESNEPS